MAPYLHKVKSTWPDLSTFSVAREIAITEYSSVFIAALNIQSRAQQG